ncbi:hypothetical protein [Pseudomonas sp. RGM 3321]|uniref:hypothetical protein n=1 Tax=Pseudomonas sp. RGM 3321 TaxID=2930089 RepID=UPI001FCBD707|nr:hypothetical protein [Pseudomonas sp. RGM 3321]MCJ2374591.1 hypothetical protein [Pseudomonas sp. RGM 3321]
MNVDVAQWLFLKQVLGTQTRCFGTRLAFDIQVHIVLQQSALNWVGWHYLVAVIFWSSYADSPENIDSLSYSSYLFGSASHPVCHAAAILKTFELYPR